MQATLYGGENRILMKRAKPLYDSAHWCVDIDEDEPELGHFWRGAGAGDKDESVFDKGEELTMNPNHFPVGTVVNISEPEDSEFYEHLFDKVAEKNSEQLKNFLGPHEHYQMAIENIYAGLGKTNV